MKSVQPNSLLLLAKGYYRTRAELSAKGSPYDQHVRIQNRLEVALGEAGATDIHWNDDFTGLRLIYGGVNYRLVLSGDEPLVVPFD